MSGAGVDVIFSLLRLSKSGLTPDFIFLLANGALYNGNIKDIKAFFTAWNPPLRNDRARVMVVFFAQRTQASFILDRVSDRFRVLSLTGQKPGFRSENNTEKVF